MDATRVSRTDSNGGGIHSIVTGEPAQRQVFTLPPSFLQLVNAHLQKVAETKNAKAKLDAEKARVIRTCVEELESSDPEDDTDATHSSNDNDAPNFPGTNNTAAVVATPTNDSNPARKVSAVGDPSTTATDPAVEPTTAPKPSLWQRAKATAGKVGKFVKKFTGTDPKSVVRKQRRAAKKEAEQKKDDQLTIASIERFSVTGIDFAFDRDFMKKHNVKAHVRFKPLEVKQQIQDAFDKFKAKAQSNESFHEHCSVLIKDLNLLFQGVTADLDYMCGTRVCCSFYPCASRGYLGVYNSFMSYVRGVKTGICKEIEENKFRERLEINGVEAVKPSWYNTTKTCQAGFILSKDDTAMSRSDKDEYANVETRHNRLETQLNRITTYSKKVDKSRDFANWTTRKCIALHQGAIDACLGFDKGCESLKKYSIQKAKRECKKTKKCWRNCFK